MRHSESSADITRSHSLVSHLHDPLSYHVRKGAAVDKEASELVDSAVTWNGNQSVPMFDKSNVLS